MTNRCIKLALFFVIFLSSHLAANAKSLQAHGLFADNMVLQRELQLPVFGKAEPDSNITVSLNGQEISTQSDSNGEWLVKIGPFSAGGPYTLNIKSNDEELKYQNVLIGDVWLASGQSNMRITVEEAKNAKKNIRESINFGNVRFFQVTSQPSFIQQDDVIGTGWLESSPKTVPDYSAVAYAFARNIFRSQGVPIGIIQSTRGASTIQQWMSIDSLLKFPEFDNSKVNNESLTVLYNSLIAPLIPYGIKGILWYQGEANIEEPELYKDLFSEFVADLRTEWNQGTFPFLSVQISSYKTNDGSVISPFRETQYLSTLEIPSHEMASTIDLGDKDFNIHPKRKDDVGKRLALLAEELAYNNSSLVNSGPIFKNVEFEDKKIRITFDNIGKGIKIKASSPKNIRGFEIAGDGGRFIKAKAKLEKGSIVIKHKFENITHVRYAWVNAPKPTVFNKEGFPAIPFNVKL